MWISFKKYIKNTYNTRIEQNECLSYKDLHDFWCKYRQNTRNSINESQSSKKPIVFILRIWNALNAYVKKVSKSTAKI